MTQEKKQKLVITWPSTPFTIEDIQASHQDTPNITLRFRVERAVKNLELTKVGISRKKIGRPIDIYSHRNITATQLHDLYKTPGVELNEKYSRVLMESGISIVPNDNQQVTKTIEEKQKTSTGAKILGLV